MRLQFEKFERNLLGLSHDRISFSRGTRLEMSKDWVGFIFGLTLWKCAVINSYPQEKMEKTDLLKIMNKYRKYEHRTQNK